MNRNSSISGVPYRTAYLFPMPPSIEKTSYPLHHSILNPMLQQMARNLQILQKDPFLPNLPQLPIITKSLTPFKDESMDYHWFASIIQKKKLNLRGDEDPTGRRISLGQVLSYGGWHGRSLEQKLVINLCPSLREINRVSFLFLTLHRDLISKAVPIVVPPPKLVQSYHYRLLYSTPSIQTPFSSLYHHPLPNPQQLSSNQPPNRHKGGALSIPSSPKITPSQIISFFSQLLVYPKALQQQMSFSNFPHQLLLVPWIVDPTAHCMPYLAYPMQNTLQVAPLEPQQNSTSPSCQNPSSYLSWEIIESRLRQLHASAQQHRKTHWSAQQDRLLSKLVEVQKLEWKQIPTHFTGRTQNMCYSRYRRISMASKDRAWSPSQEEAVLALVLKLGEKWKLISSKMPKFTPKQIRERYLNYLRPEISKEEFSLEEDLKICRFVMEHGKHWRRMEEVLPGRAEGCIKGRYYGKLQRLMSRGKDEVEV